MIGPYAVAGRVCGVTAAGTRGPRTRRRSGAYREAVSTINPGTAAVDGATEEIADANMATFLTAVLQRGGELAAGQPTRDPSGDHEGRFGYRLSTAGGSSIAILMPGVDLTRVRDDPSAAAPCLRVNGLAWWWNDAVGQVAGTARAPGGPHLQPVD